MHCDAMRILGFLRARCGREHDAMMPARDLAVDPRGRHWVLPVSTGRDQQGDTTPASSLAARLPSRSITGQPRHGSRAGLTHNQPIFSPVRASDGNVMPVLLRGPGRGGVLRPGNTPGRGWLSPNPLTKAEVKRVCLERAPSWSIELQRESLNHAIADPATGPDQSGLLHARRYG